MKPLPYQSWELQSPLGVQQLVKEMARRVEPTKWFRWPFSSNHKTFQGEIYAHGFTVSRIIRYRNSFLPIFYGRFIPAENGTTIKIIMTLHPIAWAFIAVWFGILGLFSLAGIVVLVEDGDWNFILILGCMALLAATILCVGFWAEAGNSKNLFAEIFREIHKEAASNV